MFHVEHFCARRISRRTRPLFHVEQNSESLELCGGVFKVELALESPEAGIFSSSRVSESEAANPKRN
jgi:hypothetical protein